MSSAFSPSGMKSGEFSLFCRQFSVMVQANVPISECLETLCAQPCSKVLKNALNKVYADILTGVDLSEAFSKHPKVFPMYFVGMVKTGVVGGILPEVLANAALYYENEQKHRKKLISAMTYPVFVLVLMTLLVSVLVLFVVPVFEDTFMQMGIIDPPFVTALLFKICGAIRRNALTIASVIAALILSVILLLQTKKGKSFRDMLGLKLPVFRNVLSGVVAMRFSRGMGVLLNSGTDILEAFDIVAPLTTNKYAEGKIRTAAKRLERGESMHAVLAATGLFPSVLLQMISVGEKSGNMEGVLLAVCDYLDSETESRIERLMALVQPVMFVFIGAVVALIFLAVYMPIIGMMGGI